jgi:UDP-glucose:(heptosyl)LPS alpha-1,3-glucosyltransferase
VFAFPTFYDPCSLVVLEAMHAGRPVITTRQNGAGELLTDGLDGFVIDSPWALDALTDRLRRLVSDDDLRRSMGRQAQAHAEQLTAHARLDDLLAALARAAADPTASPTRRNAA